MTTLKEVMMVPVDEWQRLQEYYKGTLTQNALLNKAGRLGAEEHVILQDKSIPDSLAIKMAAPLARERFKIAKRLRTGPSDSATPEPEDLTDTPVEALLRQLLTIKKEPATPSPGPPLKKRSRSLPSTPGPSKLPRPSGFKQSVIKGAVKGLAKSVGVTLPEESDEEDELLDLEGSHIKPKGGKRAKFKKTEKDKLHVDKPAKRGKLDYGEDSDEDFDTNWSAW